MDKRTLKLRAEKRKKITALHEERKKEKIKQAREILKIADFLKRFVNDKKYPQYKKILKLKQAAIIHDLIWLEEPDPTKNGMISEGLRKQIQQLERLLDQPKDFFEAKKQIEKELPKLSKEDED